MGHVFISYKSEEGSRAVRIRQALIAATKCSVWWDQDLQTGGRWSREVDNALAISACVIVLWSNRSVASPWVLQEAAIARARGTLLPARIDTCEIPAPYMEFQTADLSDWDGSERDEKFTRLTEAVVRLLRDARTPQRAPMADLAWRAPSRKTLGVGLIGADGTGKSTLCRALRSQFPKNKLRYISEVSRNVIAKGYPLGKDANAESYLVLMHDQLREMQHMVRNGTPFVSDRTLLDQLCYARVNSKLPRPAISDNLIGLMEYVWLLERERYKFYFYFPIEFDSIDSDGVRETDRQYQQDIDREFRKLIDNNNIPIVELRGSPQERLATARTALGRHVFGTDS